MAELNGLLYCEVHFRECCHDCAQEFLFFNGRQLTFELPENGIPEYPDVLQSVTDSQLRTAVGKRWLDMQRALYRRQAATLTTGRIRLPIVEVPDKVKTSPTALQSTLLQLFSQLQGMASAQRYYFANQSKIMLEDYDVFNKAAVLYHEELFDQYSRLPSLLQLRGTNPDDCQAEIQLLKARGGILNTLGFFLHLNTQRTFWRTFELTAEAFVQHVERFDHESVGRAVLTDEATESLLRWLANAFWALQHAQFQLDRLRVVQMVVFQHDKFPFFPYSREALEKNLDIHLIIANLSKARVHDLPHFSALFSKLRRASAIPEQMQHVNAAIMAAIDELSTRFGFLDTLVLAALLVTTEDKIKSAIKAFRFSSRGTEVNSWSDDVMEILSGGVKDDDRVGIPEKRSFLQNLIVKETQFRQRNVDRVMRPPFVLDDSNMFPKAMFETFRSNFGDLYRTSLMKQRKEDEYSLLELDVARRLQQSQGRRGVQKKKKQRAPLGDNGEKGDMGGVRSVPERLLVDPSLMWEIGDGSLEKYVPPVIRNKIKTRKQALTPENKERVVASDEEVNSVASSSDGPGEEDTAQSVERPLGQLKHTDMVTRDILWRKIKGCLKWTNLVQFLSRLGCKILNLDGSKMKIVDTSSGRCAVLHRPHPGDECRPDQRESYRVHIEDWLKIKYADVVCPNDLKDSEILEGDSFKSAATITDA